MCIAHISGESYQTQNDTHGGRLLFAMPPVRNLQNVERAPLQPDHSGGIEKRVGQWVVLY